MTNHIGLIRKGRKPEPESEEAALVCEHPGEKFRPTFSTHDYITGDPFVVGYCNACRLYVTAPVPPEREVGSYYPKGYYGSGRRFNRIVEWLLDNLYNY